MTYDNWLKTIPSEIINEPLWNMNLYRHALFPGKLARFDSSKLSQNRRTLRLSAQLYRATGKISSNIAEGYSMASGKDQAHFQVPMSSDTQYAIRNTKSEPTL